MSLRLNSRGLIAIDALKLDAATLREVLTYDRETGEFTWKVQRGGTARPGSKAGSPDRKGYILIRLGDANFKARRLAWLYVTGQWPTGVIDMIDGITNNNRFKNLRDLNHSRNLVNGKIPVNNTSGIRGVHFDRARKKWTAQIQIDGQMKYLGRTSTKEEAQRLYVIAARQYVGGSIRTEK